MIFVPCMAGTVHAVQSLLLQNNSPQPSLSIVCGGNQPTYQNFAKSETATTPHFPALSFKTSAKTCTVFFFTFFDWSNQLFTLSRQSQSAPSHDTLLFSQPLLYLACTNSNSHHSVSRGSLGHPHLIPSVPLCTPLPPCALVGLRCSLRSRQICCCSLCSSFLSLPA